jgi:hypothetical protein
MAEEDLRGMAEQRLRDALASRLDAKGLKAARPIISELLAISMYGRVAQRPNDGDSANEVFSPRE